MYTSTYIHTHEQVALTAALQQWRAAHSNWLQDLCALEHMEHRLSALMFKCFRAWSSLVPRHTGVSTALQLQFDNEHKTGSAAEQLLCEAFQKWQLLSQQAAKCRAAAHLVQKRHRRYMAKHFCSFRQHATFHLTISGKKVQ
jgi:hypothetical protein